ncbi:hypothetical protein EIN_172780 [Entamoeba invadens IP1]|uniref:Thioredoxin domain-containing protein n=1 Tax=Entamoeba invadens IP1 TaxID=370355 RepID=A0A0A1U149_ENTIV|nr:hypothetical protein EIN_172780 [Entamoeba invadens IP1]ELP84633.1 hypothetical protein EIN_172780 [Entamoeba invadens IP1]|eukprot:XP_004183979.1 hypothetical protein EIN_172780 [Entamoeba invadens IP1]
MFLFIFLASTVQGIPFELSKRNFENYIQSKETCLVMFSVKTNCPYCKDHEREFTQLSSFVDTPFAIIFCEEDNVETCEKQHIQVMPTTILFKKGEQYRVLFGMHDYGDIKNWLNDMYLPTYVEIKTQKDLETYETLNYGTVLATFPSREVALSHDDIMNFIAEDIKRFKQQFLWIVNATIQTPTLTVRTLDNEKEVHTVTFPLIYNKEKKQDLLNLVLMAFIPVMVNKNIAEPILEQLDTPVLMYYYTTRMTKATILKKVAQKYRLKLPFLTSQAQKDSSLPGHGDGKYPLISITYKRDIFPFDETMPITEENIIEFVESFLADELTPVKLARKSQDWYLEKNPPIITADIFESYKKGVDSAFLFCGSSTPSCVEYIETTFAPIVELKTLPEGLKFGFVDIDQDDVIDIDKKWQYPLIVFFKSDSKKPHFLSIETTGPVEVINFINKHSTTKILLSTEEVESLVKDCKTKLEAYRINQHNKDEL